MDDRVRGFENTLSFLREGREARRADGLGLEEAMLRHAPEIPSWEIGKCWPYEDWPGRVAAGMPRRDDGVDVVAEKRDGSLVAIQCKNRSGGGSVTARQVREFVGAAPNRSSPSAGWWPKRGGDEGRKKRRSLPMSRSSISRLIWSGPWNIPGRPRRPSRTRGRRCRTGQLRLAWKFFGPDCPNIGNDGLARSRKPGCPVRRRERRSSCPAAPARRACRCG